MKNQIIFSLTIFLLIFLSVFNKEKDIPTEINYLKIAVNGVENKTENAAISSFPVLNCKEKNAISGSFKCNFFSKSGKKIQIIGDYKVLARVLKQPP